MYNDESFIKRVDKDTVIVSTDQGKFTISREDVENFGLQRCSGLAHLGELYGDWRPIRDIAQAVAEEFQMKLPDRWE